MPYKSEKIKISGTKYDRRVKLDDEDREEIKRKFKENPNLRALGREYNVDRRTIDFIIHPEKYLANQEATKERRKKGAYKPGKKQWAATIREHRQYKQQLHINGKI